MQENLRAEWLDRLLVFLTELGDGGALWIAVAVLFLIFPKTRKAGLAMSLALILMLLTGNIGLKNIVARARPCHIYPDLEMLVEIPNSYSFPSGHTSSAFAVVFAMIFIGSRAWKWALGLACAIALSRMYVFVHFPTDILGGIALGLACGYAGAKIAQAVFGRIGAQKAA